MAPKKRSSGSQYKTIDGVKYEKDILEKAEAAVKDGQISVKEAEELWTAAMDGNRVTATEKLTLEYTLKTMKYTDAAKKVMEEHLASLPATTEAEPVATEAAATEEAKVEDAKEEAKEEAKVEAKEEVKEEEEEPAEEVKAPEEPKELEADAVGEPINGLAEDTAAFCNKDCTINVMPIAGGTILTSLGEGGMQYLLAGARANVGVKSGRYMFETRVVENLHPSDPTGSQQTNMPQKHVVRVGFSVAGSSLFLSDTDDYVCFDSEGSFCSGRKKEKVGQRFAKDTVAVVLNLDESSPNANTVSLFKRGRRIGKPQALPESLKGKTLFPTVTFRNVTLEANFGPVPHVPLPFKCHMVGTAAKADVEVVQEQKPADGKYEVIYPVGLPDQGLMDWVDEFLEKNPGYVELSDRAIIDWAVKSGIWRPKNQNSNDKPSMNFGMSLMDDGSVRRLLTSFAPTLRRNIIVAEIKGNLLATERSNSLARFKTRRFKTVAKVVMGEPNQSYKDRVQKLMLKKKTMKAENDRRHKLKDEKRKKMQEEKKKKAADARKAKAGEAEADEAEEEEAKDDDVMEDLPPIELTEEEKAIWYRKLPHKDVSEKDFAKAFTKFSLPEKEEGFDEISFEWQLQYKSAEVLKQYILDHKLTQKCEDLKPSAWFKEQLAAWQKAFSDWKKKANEWKDPSKKKALLQAKKDAMKKEKEGEPAEGEEKKEEEAIEIPEVNMEELDVFAVENVNDVGSGEPVFSAFVFEDWTLMTIMYELHLLLHAFKKDLNDPERPSFPADHLAFYYQKYYQKTFDLANYGFKQIGDFVEVLKGVLSMKDLHSKLFEPDLPEDCPLSTFIKLAENHRRDRNRRIDAGDESATLNFKKSALQNSGRGDSGNSSKGGGGKGGKGEKKGAGKGSKDKGGGGGRWVREEAPPSKYRERPPAHGASVSKRPWQESSQQSRPAPARSQPWAAPTSRRDPAPTRYAPPSNTGAKRWAPPAAAPPAWKRQRTDGGSGGGYRDSGKGAVGGKGGAYHRR